MLFCWIAWLEHNTLSFELLFSNFRFIELEGSFSSALCDLIDKEYKELDIAHIP